MGEPTNDLQTVLDAIRGEGTFARAGKVTTSAGVVSNLAQRLGVSRQTIYNYRKRWKSVDEAIEEEREVPLDLAENKLYEEVNKGNITAIIFLLKTRGKNRGYVERSEVTGENGEPLKVVIKYADTGINTPETA